MAKDWGVKIDGVQDSNITNFIYTEGLNDFVDVAVILISDNDQSLWTGTYDETYLGLDLEIFNHFGESNEYLAFKGRIANIPDWNGGRIILIINGYMAQFRDKVMSAFSTVEDPDSGQVRFTGYIEVLTASTIQDTSKAWGADDYNDVYMVTIDTLSTIPDDEQWLSLGWESPVDDVEIQASADDAYHIVNTGQWIRTTGIVLVGEDNPDNGYLRFPMNIPKDSTISTCNLILNLELADNMTIRFTLIDLNDCPAFPTGPGNEVDYPLTATTVDKALTAVPSGTETIEIKTIVEAYVARAGYVPGQYMGIKITSQVADPGEFVEISSFDGGHDIAYLSTLTYTFTPPEKIQYKITDTTADTLTLESFSLTGLIKGQGYIITKMTSELVKDAVEDYLNEDWDESITLIVQKEDSEKSFIKTFLAGQNPADIFNAARGIDGYILRLRQNGQMNHLEIQALADDAHYIDLVDNWANTASPMFFGQIAATNIYRTYLRFQINLPNATTINEAILNVYVTAQTNTPTVKVILIDTDSQTAFPNDNSAEPGVTGTEVEWTLTGTGWDTIDITTLVQAFVDRGGFVNGGYIGILIDDNEVGPNNFGKISSFDGASNLANLLITIDQPVFIYLPYSSILDSGDLDEDIENFVSSSPPNTLVNLVKVKDRYGRITTRGWNYDSDQPQDDSVTNNPFPFESQKLLPAPEFADVVTAKEIADAALIRRAPLNQGDDITLILKGDIDFQPGERIGFTYKSVNYGKGAGDHPNPFLITRKRYSSLLDKVEIHVVDYS